MGVYKVCFFLPDMRGGGAERVALLLMVEILKLGHSVDLVLLRDQGELLDLLPPEVRVIRLGGDRVRHAFFPLCRYLRNEQPSLLMVSMWPLTSLAVIACNFTCFRGKLLISEHSALSISPQGQGLRGLMLRFCMRFINARANAVVAVSRGVLDDLHHLGLPLSSGAVVHNPVQLADTYFCGTGPCDGPWTQVPKHHRILAVGALKPAKDYPLLLEAMSSLILEGNDFRLLVLGGGPLEADLLALRARLGLDEYVEFGGWVSDPSPFYHSAGCFVLSSRWEGFGNVIVEALSAGLSVVSTDCKSGPAEILQYGEFGALVPVGDAFALARAIKEALAAPSDGVALKRRAREFAPGVIAARYLELVK